MPRNARESKSRGFCFTTNNFGADEVLCLRRLGRSDGVRYLLFGRETGESGTRHLQGYIYFASPKTFRQAKAKLGERCHLEKAKGGSRANYDYCTKDGDYEEFGTRPKDPKDKGAMEKERWGEILTKAKAGDLEWVADNHPKTYLQHYSTLCRIKKDFMNVVTDADGTTGVWYYGAPGAGKSRLARDRADGLPYLKNCNKWWDGYQGQKTVIIDDLDKNHKVLGHHLKIWADRYAFIAEVKGGAIQIRPDAIVVTSNYRPEDIFDDAELIRALRRRFQVLHLITYNGENAQFE